MTVAAPPSEATDQAAAAGGLLSSRPIAGRYRLLEPLGRGGMGRVYLARDEVLDRPVALKLIYDDSVQDRDIRHACAREARAAARLNHPNIVHILDSGFDDGHLYVVMQLAHGETLATIVREAGPLPLGRALNLASQVADALDAAHQQGVVHCDVKPGNLIVDDDDHVRLVDFGIARVATSTTGLSDQLLQGSAKYVAPEQVEGTAVDGRSDVYALGVVLFEMLTGEPPFVGASVASVLAQRLAGTPPRVRDREPSVPAEIDEIVRRAMARDPRDRYQSAGLLRDALRDVQEAWIEGRLRRPADPRALTTPIQRRFQTARRLSRDSAPDLVSALLAQTRAIGAGVAVLLFHARHVMRGVLRSANAVGQRSPSLRTAIALAAIVGLLVGVTAARCGTAGVSAEQTSASSAPAADEAQRSDQPTTAVAPVNPEPARPADDGIDLTGQAPPTSAAPPPVEASQPPSPPSQEAAGSAPAPPAGEPTAPAHPVPAQAAPAVGMQPPPAASEPPGPPGQSEQRQTAAQPRRPNTAQADRPAAAARPPAPKTVELAKPEQGPPPGHGGPPRGNGNGGGKGKSH
ncbi:MAG: protein kinase [Chloroflexota bacterium]